MTIMNRVGTCIRQCTGTSLRPSLFTSPAIKMANRPPPPAATIMSSLQQSNRTVAQQFRSMATVQTTTDVASASYHFKQQKHLPYFLEYLMWVVFGSECLHLIWLKAEYKEYKEHTQHKIALFNDLLALLESNSPVPESLREEIRMVMLNEKSAKHAHHQDTDIEDDYLEKLIVASEEEDRIKAAQSITPSTPAPSSTDNHTKTDGSDGKEIKKAKFII